MSDKLWSLLHNIPALMKVRQTIFAGWEGDPVPALAKVNSPTIQTISIKNSGDRVPFPTCKLILGSVNYKGFDDFAAASIVCS